MSWLQESARRWKSLRYRLLQPIWEFVYPPHCTSCQVPLEAEQSPEQTRIMLCGECFQQFREAQGEQCQRCAAPVGPYLDTSAGCALCRDERFPFARVLALGAYDQELRRACLRAKQPGSGPLVASLARWLFFKQSDSLREFAPNIIVPIPAHWTERCWRPHFPATTVGRELASLLSIPLRVDLLGKRCRTVPQSSLSPAQRRANLKQAFRIRGLADLQGARVLLVDDVLTTGTTAARASEQLLRAGAVEILVAVLARGVGSDRLRAI
jgi:predicted amidophosphoribosyltransferase